MPRHVPRTYIHLKKWKNRGPVGLALDRKACQSSPRPKSEWPLLILRLPLYPIAGRCSPLLGRPSPNPAMLATTRHPRLRAWVDLHVMATEDVVSAGLWRGTPRLPRLDY